MTSLKLLLLAIPLAPLAGAVIAGLFGKQIGRSGAHIVTIAGVTISLILSASVFKHFAIDGAAPLNTDIYTWLVSDNIRFSVGFLVDNLTSMMMVVVTFVSLMVHIYTIGYMKDDPGYQRFFSYISLFTFSMLMLVMSNNFLQLFFGWEAVGLVSYLLIGFWYKRPTAIVANMKAFLVNRVGDFGFILGIAAIVMYTGSLDYAEVFAKAPELQAQTMQILGNTSWSVVTVICIPLFVGAMGKSAQFPLHVWLPDSMEGPTPISALIHAATMVTAGIFMVARMSPLFELSEAALSFVMIIGAITAFFMGLIGVVQNDIKRVVAYSTLSQLGYMTVALGASAYSAAVFHLMTHAFFKALLFLAAGSVIIAMHHEQDMRKMGGLRKYMPITWITSLIGTLALIGFPGMSGFFSKDGIILAVKSSELTGAGLAYWLVLLGVFVTAFYSFRLYFLVFHGKPRMDDHTREHLKESPWVVTVPLIALAVPSVLAGYLMDPIVVGDFFKNAITVADNHDTLASVRGYYHSAWSFITHGLMGAPFFLAMGGLISAWYIYMVKPEIATWGVEKFAFLHRLLMNKYYLDEFNNMVFARGARKLGGVLFKAGDQKVIDGIIINGTSGLIATIAGIMRKLQTGYLYHYTFAMIIGLITLVGWVLLK